MQPKVTILGLAYNHSQYIAQTLDSFLMQKTDFSFEVIMGDDCSTDGTADILRSYAERYPEIIRPVLRERNIGVFANFIDTFARARSEYVALCEGDDYWTDDLKLKTQMEFLETRPEHSVCFHPVIVRQDDGSGKADEVFPAPAWRFHKDTLELADLLVHNMVQTNSVLYRWRFVEEGSLAEIFPPDVLPCDWLLHLLHAECGKLGFIDKAMSVYRRHPGGCWWDGNGDAFFLRNGLPHLRFFAALQERYQREYRKEIYELMVNTMLLAAARDDVEQLVHLGTLYHAIYGIKIPPRSFLLREGFFVAEVRKMIAFLFTAYTQEKKHEKIFNTAKRYFRVFKDSIGMNSEWLDFDLFVLNILYNLSSSDAKYTYYKKIKTIKNKFISA